MRGRASGLRKSCSKNIGSISERIPPLLAKRAYWIGSFHMRDGDAAKGRAFLWRAVRAQPFNPRYLASALASLLGRASLPAAVPAGEMSRWTRRRPNPIVQEQEHPVP